MNTVTPRHLLSTLLTISTLLIAAPCVGAADEPAWHQTLADRVQLYGHRNWIVIADSAYPAQSRNGIETIATGADQIDVLRQVLSTLEGLKHVRPVAYTDTELPHVSEVDAPGITAYRKDLAELLAQQPVRVLPHEEIIAKLDEAGATFKVLILKTDLTLPYTSVFLELDCGYWNAESEKRLRAAMSAGDK